MLSLFNFTFRYMNWLSIILLLLDLMEGSDLAEHDEHLLVQSQPVADMKFTYLVSCHI